MRHRLSTTNSSSSGRCLGEVAAAVGDVGVLVVEDAFGEAVPEHFELPVAQGAQGSVVSLATLSLGVVELTGPARVIQ